MIELRNTMIFRGGYTASSLEPENKSGSAHVNSNAQCLELTCVIASKGGGKTQVCLQIGKKDIARIAHEVAERIPEAAEFFLSAAAIGQKKLNEQLTEINKKQISNTEINKKSIGDLQQIEEFVKEKYNEAPAGSDEEEEEIYDLITKIISSLETVE